MAEANPKSPTTAGVEPEQVVNPPPIFPKPNNSNNTEQGDQTPAQGGSKRKLNLSPHATSTQIEKKAQGIISPDRKKVKGVKGKGKGKGKRSKRPPNPKSSQDSLIIESDYDSEDNEPLSGLSGQSPEQSDTQKLHARKVVRARQFRRTLQRRGTPLKSNTKQPDNEEPRVHTPGNSGTRDVERETEKNDMLAILTVLKAEITTIKVENNEGKTAIQADIEILKGSVAECNKSIHNFNKSINHLSNQQITKDELLDAVKVCVAPLSTRIEKQEVESNRHTEQLGALEEKLSAMHVSAESFEKRLDNHGKRMDGLAHRQDNLQAEICSELDELKRRLNIQEKREYSSQSDGMKTYAEVTSQPMTEAMERSIILEGLIEYPNEQIDEQIMLLASELSIPLNDWEINKVERIGYKKADRQWPRPVKVEFTTVRKQQMFLLNRVHIRRTENFYNTRLRPDETKETRILKAKFRNAAKSAREKGLKVYQRSELDISIDGKRYTEHNLDELIQAQDTTTMGRNRNQPLNTKMLHGKFGDTTSYRITPKGLAFFGARSMLSSFYPCSIVNQNRVHSTLEHGYQGDKAEDAGDTQRVKAIYAAPTPRVAKGIGGEIPNSTRWNNKKKEVMRTWLWRKYTQNKVLGDFLCSTEGYGLIEASPFDSWWGTGVGLNDPALMRGEWNGKNSLGEELERVRDILLTYKRKGIDPPADLNDVSLLTSVRLPPSDLLVRPREGGGLGISTTREPARAPFIVDITPAEESVVADTTTTPAERKTTHDATSLFL